jgi:Na+-transporting NADH:ubiquinone oxidoreductase subunit C
MKDSAYSLLYAAVLGTVCALLLTGVGEFTKPYREANARAERVSNILGVLGVPVAEDASTKELLKVFEETVRVEEADGSQRYVYAEEGQTQAIALPFAGQGLWGPIRGFVAVRPDWRTIRAITFHEQEETPGLGGEIASQGFRQQFQDLALVGPEGAPGIRIVQDGSAAAANEVDGITGATMTCSRVERMLNRVLVRAVKEHGSHGQ